MNSEKSVKAQPGSPFQCASEDEVLQALENAGLVRAIDVDKETLTSLISTNSITNSATTKPAAIPENQVMERAVQYCVEPDTNPKTGSQTAEADADCMSAAKHYRIYLNVNLPASYQHITAQWNQKEMAKMEMVFHPTQWQHRFTPLLSHSETEVALMLRFVKQRTMFFEQHTMLSADDVLEVLGLARKNPRRTVRELAAKHQLILFKYENKLQAPAFQFNAKGHVYPALLKALPQFHEKGIEPLELALWLVNHYPALLAVQPPCTQTGELSFEAMLEQAETARQRSEYYEAKPIDMLAQQKDLLFDLMVQRWLHSDEKSPHFPPVTPQ